MIIWNVRQSEREAVQIPLWRVVRLPMFWDILRLRIDETSIGLCILALNK